MSRTTTLTSLLRPLHLATLAMAIGICALAAPTAAETNDAGDLANARALLREPLAFTDLDPAVTAKILERIGRTHLLKDELAEALKVYQEAYTYFKNPEMTNAVTTLTAAALTDFLRFEEAAKLWLDLDQPLKAADVYDHPKSPFADKARVLRLAVLKDTKRSAAERRRAYPAFLTQDRADIPVATQYYDLFITDNTRSAAATFRRLISYPNNITVGSTAFYGDFEGTLRYFGWLKPLLSPNPDFQITVCALNAYAALGRLDEAIALAREATAYETFTPQEVYQMKMTLAGLGMRDEKANESAFQSVFFKTDADAVKSTELTPAERAKAIELTGATLLHGRLESAARAIDAFRLSLYAPEPRKHYTVTYSAKPISGLDTWKAVAPNTEKQAMDRKYGGNLDFLVTDVSTGDRGAGIGGETDDATTRLPEISFICDINGVHFRCDTFDTRARDVEAKLLGAGSYEGYIAAGENQPYVCYLIDIQSGNLWKDPVIGDPEFYTLHLEPLVEHLDTYIPLVKADMSGDDVEKVFSEAVPSWNNIPSITADLRSQFLAKMFTE